MKPFVRNIIATAAVTSFTLFGAVSIHATELNVNSFDTNSVGGWVESQGNWITPSLISRTTRSATPNHRGASEETVINGTSHKRAHGWTTWAGVHHYTTARLEHYWPASGIIANSGRQWGTGGTEAATEYVAFNPHAASNGFGIAKTYYGK